MRRTISVGIVRFRSENAWSFAMSSARTEIVRRSLACFCFFGAAALASRFRGLFSGAACSSSAIGASIEGGTPRILLTNASSSAIGVITFSPRRAFAICSFKLRGYRLLGSSNGVSLLLNLSLLRQRLPPRQAGASSPARSSTGALHLPARRGWISTSVPWQPAQRGRGWC